MEHANWKKKITIFLISQSITLFGSSLVQFAIIWSITKSTGSGLMTSMITLCAFLPQVIISLFSGAWADRFNRKTLIICADAFIAFCTLILALCLIFQIEHMWMLFLITALRSLGTGVQTPAVNAILPQWVPSEKLMKINGYNGSIQSLITILSPAAAGVILSFSPFYFILLIDTVTAAIGIAMMFVIHVPAIDPQPIETGYRSDIRSGFAYCFHHKFFRKLFFIFALYSFLVVPSGFLSNLLVTRQFGDLYFYMSVNEIVGAAGMFAGGLIIGISGGFKNRLKTLFVGIIGYGVASILIGISGFFWLYLIFMGILCIFMPFTNTAVMTLLQENVPSDMQGRMFAIMQMIFSSLMPLGMIVFGPLADFVPIQTMIILCGILIVATALLLRLDKKFYHFKPEKYESAQNLSMPNTKEEE